MAQKIYSKGAVFVDGNPIAEATNISARYSNNSNAVDTIEQGRSGRSPGAASSTVTITSAVPAAGVDMDYLKSLLNLTLVEVVVFARGKKIKMKGFFTEVEEEYGVGSQTFRATIECGPPDESTL